MAGGDADVWELNSAIVPRFRKYNGYNFSLTFIMIFNGCLPYMFSYSYQNFLIKQFSLWIK
jgi:hypothetical protein